jgi:hypothetical protein
MQRKLNTDMIVRTHRSADARILEVTFARADGSEQTLRLTVESVASLAGALQDCKLAPQLGGPTPTKMPRHFAVGSGRYEQVVLVRFEDDTPYGLSASQASELGQALVEQAETVGASVVMLRQ